MKSLSILIVCLFVLSAISLVTTEAGDCSANKEKEKCDATDYDKYITCVRGRSKRSACDNSCDNAGACAEECKSCECDGCEDDNECENDDCEVSSCCSTCCNKPKYQRCRTNHCCHKTCHSECKTNSCRKTCRKSCYDTILKQPEYYYPNRTEIFPAYKPNNTVSNTHNITTIIHLNNLINNTQLIEVPINLNYTQQNNVTIRESGGGYYDGEYTNVINKTVVYVENNNTVGPVPVNTQCCVVIGPKQCKNIKEYPGFKCFHTRSKQCGEICSADIMHMERRQVCYGGPPQPECREQVLYIPQPQPKCVYQYSWPYVSCGVQVKANCAGCYGHYANKESKPTMQCPMQCYNDFGGSGPYYRQGPYYQPSYSPTGPCYFPSDCGGYGGPNSGYGMPQSGGGVYPGGGYPAMGGYMSQDEMTVEGNQIMYGDASYNDTGSWDPMVNVMMPPPMMEMPMSVPRQEVQIQAEIEEPENLKNASFVSDQQKISNFLKK